MLREPGRPNVAYMVTPDKERRYVGGAFITLNEKMRERLWARVNAGAKPLKGASRRSPSHGVAEARPARWRAAPSMRVCSK